ncbi:hypothetical protein MGN70_001249 [Eutypa lata]|nr:hypothetical protein MGN70_001249 [Eutypa lata]
MELPEGYTESEITWTGLEHLLDDSEGVNASAIKAVAGLSLKGPIQSVMAQLESMGHSVLKPNLNDTEFESKMDEILAEDREDNTQAVSTTP